jgi:alpha-beta hydrolase superfamily lysophospholipase
MLYKFKSPATGDLIMLEPNGRRVLQVMGKDAGSTGIILPEQMPAAIDALTNAITREEAEQQAAVAQAKATGEAPPSFDAVSLRKRAWPMVEMLQRSAKENAPVTWGV